MLKIHSKPKLYINIRRGKKAQMEFFAQISKRLERTLDFKVLLNHISSLMLSELADLFTIDIINEKGDVELLTIAHSNPEKVKWGMQLREKTRIGKLHEKNLRKVIKTGTSKFFAQISLENFAKLHLNEKEIKIIKKLGPCSTMIVPLISREKVIGAITLVTTEESNRQYNESDLRTVEYFAKTIALSIENAKLYQRAQQEIRERKRTENDLKKINERFDIILQNIADGITVQDRQGRIIFANEAAKKVGIFSFPPETLSPRSFKEHLERYELRDEYRNPLSLETLPGKRALSGEKKPEAIVNYLDKIKKTATWSLVKARPIYDENREIQFAVNIISDITEQKEAEKRKDQFIITASHELKTPLTTIKAFIELLHRKVVTIPDKPELALYLQKMDKQVDRLTALIRDLLDVSKIQAGKLEYQEEVFEINKLISEAVESAQYTTVKHKLILRESEYAFVYADPFRIAQVIQNLLSNAIKYSPKKGKIIIDIKPDEKFVTVCVTDSGVGIPKDKQDKIFQRFYRVLDKKHESFPGLGIGLHIASEIVKRYGGEMWVDSKEKHGSKFSFTLPVFKKTGGEK